MIFIPRSAWAPPSTRPRVDLDRRERLVVHHTVTIEPDDTPVIWSGRRAILDHQRRLAKMRPDLIDDIPYQLVGYFTAGPLVIVEGLGLDRIGAHVAGKNTASVGFALAGNFETYEGTPEIFEHHCYEMRYAEQWCSWTFGRDLPWEPHQAHDKTLCPGKYVLRLLEELRLPF